MPHKPCPPCPPPLQARDLEEDDTERQKKQAVFFSWNRAHFGAWVITSSPLILGMWPSDEKLAPFLDVIGNSEA